MCCGTKDFLYDLSKDFVDYLNVIDIPITYEEECYHDFNYWDTKIQRVLDWMELK